jgi:hypothetical protein
MPSYQPNKSSMNFFKTQFSTILLMVVSMYPTLAQKKKGDEVQQPALAKEIRAMRDAEQKMRIKWSNMVKKDKSETDKFKELTKTLIAEDRDNTARMREIVSKYGWPTFEMVGLGPSNNAWLIVQHADRNPLFQIKCLPLLKAAVDADQANPSNYAYLYDRVQVATGEKQLYATQSTSNNGLAKGYFYPIEGESNVQNRREEMGIMLSVEECATSMGFDYTIPTEEEARVIAEELVVMYNNNLAKAKEAVSQQDYYKAADHYLLLVEANGMVTTEDFVAAARYLSISKHPKASIGTTFLTRAIARGWDGFKTLNNDPDFGYLRELSPFGWSDLQVTAEQALLDK